MDEKTIMPIIGWREWIAIPSLKIPGVKAKIDTGARSSSLHTHDFEVFDRHGTPWVRFHLHPLPRREDILLSCEAPILEFRSVKDSGGHPEERPFIRTEVRLGEHIWEIDLSLTNREGMKFRMLLGREALAGNFIIDPATSYQIGKKKDHDYRA